MWVPLCAGMASAEHCSEQEPNQALTDVATKSSPNVRSQPGAQPPQAVQALRPSQQLHMPGQPSLPAAADHTATRDGGEHWPAGAVASTPRPQHGLSPQHAIEASRATGIAADVAGAQTHGTAAAVASPRPALWAPLSSVLAVEQKELSIAASSMHARGETRREQQSPYPANSSGTTSPARELAAEEGRTMQSGELLGVGAEGAGQVASAEACTQLPAHHPPMVGSHCRLDQSLLECCLLGSTCSGEQIPHCCNCLASGSGAPSSKALSKRVPGWCCSSKPRIY